MFHDPPDFLDLYFGQVYRDSYVETAYDGDRLIGAVQTIPRRFQFSGHVFRAGYVCGVCTDERYRNRHVMSGLLEKTISRTQADLLLLLPAEDWLYDYYGRFGFAAVFRREERDVTDLARREVGRKLPPMSESELIRFVETQNARRKAVVLHDACDLKTIIADNRLSGGSVVSYNDGGDAAFAAFCYPEGGGVVVRDWFCLPGGKSLRLMLSGIAASYPGMKICLRKPGGKRYGMARVTNVGKFLPFFPARKEEVLVEDPLIAGNNRALRLDSCPADGKGAKMTIAQFTQRLFQSSCAENEWDVAWMSLMLE